MKLIELEDAFEIGSNEINPESNSLEIYIKNKVNYNFENLDIEFSSAFFDTKESFSLKLTPYYYSIFYFFLYK